MNDPQRKSTQPLLPLLKTTTPAGQYDIYPAFPIGSGKLFTGYDELAERISDHSTVLVDGYVGVFWDHFQLKLDAALARLDIRVQWVDVQKAMRPCSDIEQLVAPFLGGDDPIFGTRFTREIQDFFNSSYLTCLEPDPTADMSIGYGCGAGLLDWDAYLIYVDVPKNEIQYRSRAGAITNLGAAKPNSPKSMYKRFYFVDWIALNRHKAALLPHIDFIVDAQRPESIVFTSGNTLRQSLTTISKNYFRVRPWFEPGAWGGEWIKKHIPQLPQDVPNYAWSFELIGPENGLLLESDHKLLEISFDFLMYHAHQNVLGDSARRFGHEFPIRFDFLDTFDGSNLSVQCHPRPEYIRQHFGENFTQDETYYILDCGPDAVVYLGFHDDIDPIAFHNELEESQAHGRRIAIEDYVQTHPAHKHDLFLIPNGTIHCSGTNNLVLEISATPYIFTFKMYDWLRLDLDGKPRPINIGRAFENLRFERKGEQVEKKLISTPQIIEQGDGWQLIHLPTHAEHFYDVHRFDIDAGRSVEVPTNGSFHVMSLVEGSTVTLETNNGLRNQFNFAETFVVPAAAESYHLKNSTDHSIKVIKAFVKPDESEKT
jgi:mannose-6-phosphate isomerase class I